jgi:shikimate dehydrogenase
MRPSAKARIAGIVGWPVGHSRSPRLHGFWLDHYGIDGAYIPLPIAPEHLSGAIAALPRFGFRGANVTVPHKEAVARLCDAVDPIAERIGAVNTLVIGEGGDIRGANTDAFGFAESVRAAVGGVPAGPAAVLGAGGAARAVVAALAEAGCADIRLVNRTEERARVLADRFGSAVRPLAWSDAAAALDGAAFLVNTTSLGMIGQPPPPLGLDPLPKQAVVADIVYAPLRTALLARAAARGNPIVDGLGMLIHQARPGFEAWFGVRPDADAVKAVRAVLEDDLNREQGGDG